MIIYLKTFIDRKNLSEPELAVALKEYDEMKRRLEGEQPRGKHRSLLNVSDDGWTQDKTASDLNISRQTVSRAIQIAKAVEEYPEKKPKRPRARNSY